LGQLAFNGGMHNAGAFNGTKGKRAAKEMQKEQGRVKRTAMI